MTLYTLADRCDATIGKEQKLLELSYDRRNRPAGGKETLREAIRNDFLATALRRREMPFKYEELVTQIEKFKGAEDGAWVVVIGCAPASAKCPEPTQVFQFYLEKPINHQDNPDATTAINLGFLKQALEDKLAEIKALSREVTLQDQKTGSGYTADESEGRG